MKEAGIATCRHAFGDLRTCEVEDTVAHCQSKFVSMFNAQVGSEVVPVHVLADVNQSLYPEPGFATTTG